MCKLKCLVICAIITNVFIFNTVRSYKLTVNIYNTTDVVELCPENKDTTKLCNCRTNKFPRNYWTYVSGFFCFNFTNYDRYEKSKIKVYSIPTNCPELGSKISLLPIMEVFEGDSTYAFFDYTNATSVEIIKRIFKKEDDFKLFLDCCQVAVNCCDKETNATNVNASKEYCPVVFDAWDCFPQTKVNSVAKKVCSPQTKPACKAYSEKYCNWDEDTQLAKWVTKTNYMPCTKKTIYERRHTYNVITLFIAIFLTLPSIGLFLSFSKLRRQTRIILHRNLLITIVIRSTLTILSKKLIILHQLDNDDGISGAMNKNSVGCRILSFTENVFKNGIYACMLVDGFYLHKVIVRTFATDPNLVHLYVVVLGVSLVPSIIWATVKGVAGQGYCWLVDYDNEQWIVDGCRVAVLTINVILLLDIIRVMFTKMTQSSTSRQTKAAFKATAFLIPLFGLQFIITADKNIVYDDTCVAQDVYEYSRYTLEALQGVIVAILFCYLNSEVHTELKNVYRKLRIYLEQRFGWYGRRSTKMRRDTTATYVPEGRLSGIQ